MVDYTPSKFSFLIMCKCYAKPVSNSNVLAFNVDIFIEKSDWLESYKGTKVFDTDFEWISVIKL